MMQAPHAEPATSAHPVGLPVQDDERSTSLPAAIRRRAVNAIGRVSREPPFRLLSRFALKHLRVSVDSRANWDISERPAYLLGLLTAAKQANEERRTAISAIEFGVAGGRGLLALQWEADAVEKEYGVEIRVYGFDMGASGLPELIGDHRDHPEKFKRGDFPMAETELRARLSSRTELIIGNVRDTVEAFVESKPPPLGFVAFDMDLYSSTRDAFRILTHPERRMLVHCPLYFDDLGSFSYHDDAGELLAIRELNERAGKVKIHPWLGVRHGRPFPEAPYLDHMYVAHDLEGASRSNIDRPVAMLSL